MSLSEESRQLEQSNSTLTNLYTEKIRKAASKAVIDIAVNELVSAMNCLHSSKPKAHSTSMMSQLNLCKQTEFRLQRQPCRKKSQGQSMAR